MKLLTLMRERRGWSRAELARRADLHASQVGAFENGRLVPYAGQLSRLARALDFDGNPSDLLEARDEAAAGA
jgi:ribosome-binding protein aMBF1 (putative translation factor)